MGVYFAAYWLRFQGDRLETFLPGAWSTLPVVVASQLAVLVAVGAYARRPRIDWLLRVLGGILAGTTAAAGVLAVTMGFEGVSRSAFLADAVFLSVAAVGWRAIWVLKARAEARARAGSGSDSLVDRAASMTTVRGAVVGLYQYRELLKNLVLKDLKLKYRGSVFGFLWSLVNPLLMIIVYAVAFTFILRIRSEGFVFFLMLGQLSWTLFASSAAMSTGAIVDNSGLLKSVLFPRAILPIGTVLFNLAQYLLTVSVFLPVMLLWYRVPLSGPMALFPVFLALQVIFTIGVALILSTATAFFRDVRHLLEVALSVLFWTTPILYELRQVPEPPAAAHSAEPGLSVRRRIPADVLLQDVARRDGLAPRRRPRGWCVRDRIAAVPVLRRPLHGAAVMAAVIEAQDVSKRFLLKHNASVELKVRFLGLLHKKKRESVEEFWALKNVSIGIEHGEAIGLVGRNGSGKSTLLKLIAGIHRPTSGRVLVARGARISSMIELGIGFHPELTGRENVVLSASIHGLTKAKTERIFDAVVEYSGLAHFIDVPIKNYSSGMYMRLGFAIAANLDPDILLLDEIFAVGDADFQERCTDTINRFMAEGKTVVFVSHAPASIRSICRRVCVLEQGELMFDGAVDEGLAFYEHLLHPGTAEQASPPPP